MSVMLKDFPKWKAIEFVDWAEFLDYAETPLPKHYKDRCGADSFKSYSVGNVGFHGTNSYSEAMSLARGGWQDGIEKMNRLRRKIDHLVRAAAAEKAQSMRFDLSGEWMDMGRVVMGNPECWGGFQDIGDARADKVVTITINLACSASLSDNAIFARGAVCLAAVDLIEAIGHRVELRVGSCAENDEGRFEYQVIAKKASDPLDIDRLTFFLCHKSGPRRYGFACYEHLGRRTSGKPTQMLGVKEGDVYVPELLSDRDWDEKTLEKKVIAMCREAGIEFEGDVLQNILHR